MGKDDTPEVKHSADHWAKELGTSAWLLAGLKAAAKLDEHSVISKAEFIRLATEASTVTLGYSAHARK